MIKDSIPSTPERELDHNIRIETIVVAAINRLKEVHYDNAKNLKKDLEEVRDLIGDQHSSTLQLRAAKSGLIEAIARAIIMLERFNELDAAKSVLEELDVYYRGMSYSYVYPPFSKTLIKAHLDHCEELDKKLDGITDAKEREITTAAILYKKQRLLAMVEYAGKLCEKSKKLSTIDARFAFADARSGIGYVYSHYSTVKLVEEEGKLTLVVKPPAIKPLYFEL
ncbi:hypothetical protein GQ42DRAFT_165655 [Ramicandelaber brevisporus]|nr:hypothetical protein GQ42DRAFT_165655 [Ramicandelaber brevisporus]